MRFPVLFRRQKGSASSDPVLPASASAPSGPPSPATTPDNLIATVGISKEGWPIQRIVACWTTTAGSPTALNANLYFYEEALQAWILVNSAPVSMSPGVMYFFDVAVVIPPPQTLKASGAASNQGNTGSVECALVVWDPGAQVNGVFSIACGADLSSVGT